MIHCEECEWFYRSALTQRRLCRATFQLVSADSIAEGCQRFESLWSIGRIDDKPSEDDIDAACRN